MNDEIRLDHERLDEFASAVLQEAGLAQRHADIVADSLVDANLHGIDTHGVFKLEEYAERLQRGGMNPDPEIGVDRTRSATAVVDGDDGPGQSVALTAMDEAIDFADETGSGFVSVRNSHHIGTAAYYTRHAAEQGHIGLCMTHAGQNVVPFGGTEPYFGTNPISISIPREDGFPITLDMATSVKAKSAVALAEKRGEEVPDDWIIDEDGEPTTDPSEFHGLRPLGGPKGYGLAFMVEALCGILADTVFGKQVPSSDEQLSSSQDLAHFLGAIDLRAFANLSAYTERLNTMVDELKREPTTEGLDEILVPGEPEHRTKQRRAEEGIPFSPEEWDDLQTLADGYGVTLRD